MILSALQTKASTFENSVDPEEMDHNEPSHLNLHCLPFCFRFFFFFFFFFFCFVFSICINGFLEIQTWKSPLQTLRGERIKSAIPKLANQSNVYVKIILQEILPYIFVSPGYTTLVVANGVFLPFQHVPASKELPGWKRVFIDTVLFDWFLISTPISRHFSWIL